MFLYFGDHLIYYHRLCDSVRKKNKALLAIADGACDGEEKLEDNTAAERSVKSSSYGANSLVRAIPETKFLSQMGRAYVGRRLEYLQPIVFQYTKPTCVYTTRTSRGRSHRHAPVS